MRKKLFLFLTTTLLLSSLSVLSQGQSGGITAELNGNLFVQDETFITPTFAKVRYFITDEIAVRLSGWANFASDQEKPESTFNYLYFSARPGAEYHLASEAGAFSAYVGAEIIIDYTDRSFDTQMGVPITGAWDITNIQNFTNRGFISYGGSLLAGADIYIGGGSLYLGTEFGLAYTYTNHAEVLYGNDLYLGKSKGSAFIIDLSRVFRVGFKFN